MQLCTHKGTVTFDALIGFSDKRGEYQCRVSTQYPLPQLKVPPCAPIPHFLPTIKEEEGHTDLLAG